MSLRLDAHQHFWRYRPAEFGWIDGRMAGLQRDHLPADLQPHLQRAGFDGCIAVQARTLEEETDFLLDLAARTPWVQAVVGWTDLRAADLVARLERRQGSRHLRGFRHPVQDEADPGAWLADAAANRGVATLQRHGYLYELLIHAETLPAATAFAARHDHGVLVLDHLGKPPGRVAPADYARLLAPLARLPHVHCKLSGLVTEADWHGWQAEQLLPYARIALEAFGPERLLFGSDWPVCTLAASYAEVIDLAEQALLDLTPSERGAVFGGNAARLYGLGTQPREAVA
ncbi:MULTISPECIES: amidohydrolase family protein [unclassified Pseudomonas]|uniref:amidohydrolase family protein n=1 Tax=unclassified Pseudomonas TaxID=196821 RepID=UPI002360DCA5|nr:MULTISPECIES: amidohydrolase family protein [unclassified Pseudomonas]MDR6179876.1 L-fuconolactonase [Pseudomonas sp. SORGH_AS_0211]